jgi:uncharacterized phage protein (TIGR02218 family)
VKAASGPLITLLASGDFQMADLYTITLRDGSVVRWSGADVMVYANGFNYALGPAIDRGSISEKIGTEVGALELTIIANGDDLIAGTPVIPFILAGGLDGANLRLDRAFSSQWNLPAAGTVLRFSGRITSIGEIGGSTAKITVSAWTILLNVNMPPHLYQASCAHAVYDAGCTLNPASFSSTGTVQAGVAGPPDTRPTLTTWLSNLTLVPDKFTLGRVTFTSGPNAGITRGVRTNASDGTFEIVNPLPVAPVAGNTFTAVWGCDRTSTTCSGKFNNLQHFKGTEFVPSPETAL